jgi:O-antigen ligase
MSVAVAAVALLASDSRMALAAAVGVAAISLMFRRRLAFPAAVIVLAVMTIAPIALLKLTEQLDGLTLAQRVARSQSDLSTLNTRDEVWQGALAAHSAGSMSDQFVGYGAWGHVTSGATAYYEHLFSRAIEAPTVHNAVLQHLLDSGYIGIFVFAGFVLSCLRRLSAGVQADLPFAHPLFALLLYLAVNGITEATATVYHQESLGLLLFLSGAAASLPATLQVRQKTGRHWRVQRAEAGEPGADYGVPAPVLASSQP